MGKMSVPELFREWQEMEENERLEILTNCSGHIHNECESCCIGEQVVAESWGLASIAQPANKVKQPAKKEIDKQEAEYEMLYGPEYKVWRTPSEGMYKGRRFVAGYLRAFSARQARKIAGEFKLYPGDIIEVEALAPLIKINPK